MISRTARVVFSYNNNHIYQAQGLWLHVRNGLRLWRLWVSIVPIAGIHTLRFLVGSKVTKKHKTRYVECSLKGVEAKVDSSSARCYIVDKDLRRLMISGNGRDPVLKENFDKANKLGSHFASKVADTPQVAYHDRRCCSLPDKEERKKHREA